MTPLLQYKGISVGGNFHGWVYEAISVGRPTEMNKKLIN